MKNRAQYPKHLQEAVTSRRNVFSSEEVYEYLSRLNTVATAQAINHETMKSRMTAVEESIASIGVAPRVQYVESFGTSEVAQSRLAPQDAIFILTGLVCSVIFGTLLALSSFSIQLVHPIISLIGLIGGLGWFVIGGAHFLRASRPHDKLRSPARRAAITQYA